MPASTGDENIASFQFIMFDTPAVETISILLFHVICHFYIIYR